MSGPRFMRRRFALEPRSPELQRRMETAWKDPEVTVGAFEARFSVGPVVLVEFEKALGPKARLGAVSVASSNERRRSQRQRKWKLTQRGGGSR